jgi:osmotically-inducible protein OsmY
LPYTDAVIQRNVSLQLASDPVLRSAAIQATVLNGTATLNGVVSTWGERRQAQLDAYAAGARLVNNKLLVQTRATDNSGAAR